MAKVLALQVQGFNMDVGLYPGCATPLHHACATPHHHACGLGKPLRTAPPKKALGPCTPMGDPEEAPDLWLQISSAPALVPTCGGNQQMKFFLSVSPFLCHYDFNEMKCIFKNKSINKYFRN